ncbi:MAG: lysophospholipid acyltransferase family protein [Myxococcota bacterium]
MKRLAAAAACLLRVTRGLWRWLGIALAVTFCATLSLPTLAITGDGRLGHRIFARGWGRFTLWWCGVSLRVEGFPPPAGGPPMVIVANHVSHYGFYAIAAAFPVQWRAVLRREMRRIPVFGYVAAKAGHIFVGLGQRDRAGAAMRAGIDRLREGHWLLVFPEGRPAAGALFPFRTGAFRLAIEAGAPVLPVALVEIYRTGAHRNWSEAPRCLSVRTGRPIETAGLSPDDAPALAARARSEIVAILEAA